MDFIIHDAAGNILRYGNCAASDLSIQTAAGETALPTTYVPGVVINGAIQPLTATQVAANTATDRKAIIAGVLASRKGPIP